MAEKRGKSTLFSFGIVKKPRTITESNASQEVPKQSSSSVTLEPSKSDIVTEHQLQPNLSDSLSAVNLVKSKPVPADKIKAFLNSSFGADSHVHSFYACDQNCTNISKVENERIKGKDRFQHSWILDPKLSYCSKTGYYWLVYEEGKGMYCILCRKHNSINPQNKTKKFNLEASVRYKRKTVEEHACTAQHTASVEAELMSRVSTFQKQIDKLNQVREDVYYKAFLTLYWIAKEELPNRKFTSLLELLEKLELSDIEYFQHRSGGSVREMFLVLGQEIKEQVQKKTRMANVFSILCDEVCDISNKEQVITFVQYVDQDSSKADVKFLAGDDVLEEFTSANSIAIKSTIFKQMDDSELEISKLAGIATDGCSVMTGKNNGVAALIRREFKLVLNVHCICHRLALACGDANDDIAYIKTVEKILTQLWSFFKNSAKKSASYAKAALAAKSLAISNDGKKGIAKKFKKACRTRWLSTEMALAGVYEDFIPLTQTLRVYKEDNDCAAIGLLKQVGDVKFLSAVYLLHEVLPALSHLSKAFQRGTISFSAIDPAIKYTIDQLNEIATSQMPLERLKKTLEKVADFQALG